MNIVTRRKATLDITQSHMLGQLSQMQENHIASRSILRASRQTVEEAGKIKSNFVCV